LATRVPVATLVSVCSIRSRQLRHTGFCLGVIFRKTGTMMRTSESGH
jgi:hypothetical protein